MQSQAEAQQIAESQQLEPAEQIQPHLTTDQAFEIARSRGYTSNRNSFKDWSARKPDDCRSLYGLVRFVGQKGDRSPLTFADVRSPNSLKNSDAVPGQLVLID